MIVSQRAARVQVDAAPHFHSSSHIRNTCPANGSASGRSMVMSLVVWIRLAGEILEICREQTRAVYA